MTKNIENLFRENIFDNYKIDQKRKNDIKNFLMLEAERINMLPQKNIFSWKILFLGITSVFMIGVVTMASINIISNEKSYQNITQIAYKKNIGGKNINIDEYTPTIQKIVYDAKESRKNIDLMKQLAFRNF